MINCNDPSLDEKEPILRTQGHLTKLIVEDCHKRTLHSGTRATLIHLRTVLDTPRVRSFTRKIIRKCNSCCRIDSKSYRYPRQSALPSYRINTAPPFSVVGNDYTGHLFVKSNTEEQTKAYIVVSPAAIHPEFVTDMKAEQFFLAFRRGKSFAQETPRSFAWENPFQQQSYRIMQLNSLTANQQATTFSGDVAIQQHFNKHKIKWIHMPGGDHQPGEDYTEDLLVLSKTY